MRSIVRQIGFLIIVLGASAAARSSRAGEVPNPADQTRFDWASGTPVSPDAGIGQTLDLPPAEGPPAAVDAGLADNVGAATHADAGSDARGLADGISPPMDVGDAKGGKIPPQRAAKSTFGGGSIREGENVQVVTAHAAPSSPKRLPIFGAMADVGFPDGIIGSLVFRPWGWVRLSGGGGSNLISRGWRTGITLLPFGTGPSASFEYGRYRDGDANALARKVGFGSSPVLERVGYEFMNAHLGMDFGFRRVVLFIHAGVTMIRGQIHNLDAAISDTIARDTAGTGTIEVNVRQDPNARLVAPSIKLGLIGYIW